MPLLLGRPGCTLSAVSLYVGGLYGFIYCDYYLATSQVQGPALHSSGLVALLGVGQSLFEMDREMDV